MALQIAAWIKDRLFIKQPRLRRAVTRLISGSQDRDVDLAGSQLTVNSERENGYVRAAKFSAASSLLRDEIPVLINLAYFVAECDAFVDIGANVGVYASILSRLVRVKPGFRVYAFEVDPETYKRLRVNSERHGFTAYNIGILDVGGEREFVRGAVSHVTVAADHQNAYSIPAERFGAECKRLSEFPIDGQKLILKIDVEGLELEVLEGARELFESKRVAVVYLDGYKDARVREFLAKYGFRFYDGRTLEPNDGRCFSLLAISL